MKSTLQDLAELVGGKVVGDAGLSIEGVAGIREAQPGDITFLANTRYTPLLSSTQASAVVVAKGTTAPPETKSLLTVDNPDLAFAQIVKHFNGEARRIEKGVHPTAVIGTGVRLGHNVSIGANCVVEEGAEIGDEAILYPHVYLGHKAKVGAHTLIYPMVVIRDRCEVGDRVILHSGVVIGTDGFGYATVDGNHQKIPQMGIVIVEEDVEIGAGTCVARARFEKTIIRKGTKIDNLVQIGHNVEVGDNNIIVAQSGIAGSARLGKNVIMGGQSGIGGHIEVGDGAVVMGRAGVTKNVAPGSMVSGLHAMDHQAHLRQLAAARKLPAILLEVKALRERIEELESELHKARKQSS